MKESILELLTWFPDKYCSQVEDWVVHSSFIAYFLAYANSAINPVLYGGLNPAFRKAFRRSMLANVCSAEGRLMQDCSLRLGRRDDQGMGSMTMVMGNNARRSVLASPDECRSVVLTRAMSKRPEHRY
jgi:hypothetical protein